MSVCEDLVNILEIQKSGHQRSKNHQPFLSSAHSSVQSENYQIYVQVFALYKNETVDLIRDKKFRIDQEAEEGTTKVEIKLLQEFKSLYRTCMNQWIQLN